LYDRTKCFNLLHTFVENLPQETTQDKSTVLYPLDLTKGKFFAFYTVLQTSAKGILPCRYIMSRKWVC